MKRTNITIQNDTDKLVREYASKNNIAFSKAIDRLIIMALEQEKNIDVINNIKNEISVNNKNSYIIIDLIKQLYSDLEIDNITDPNKNKGLKSFFNNRKKDKYND